MYVVLGAEVFGKGSAHDLATDVRGGREMGFTALATGTTDTYRTQKWLVSVL